MFGNDAGDTAILLVILSANRIALPPGMVFLITVRDKFVVTIRGKYVIAAA